MPITASSVSKKLHEKGNILFLYNNYKKGNATYKSVFIYDQKLRDLIKRILGIKSFKRFALTYLKMLTKSIHIQYTYIDSLLFIYASLTNIRLIK